MPVCAGQFYRNRIVIPDPGAECFDKHHQQGNYTSKHMQHVQSEYDIKKLSCSRTFETNTRRPQLMKTDKLHNNKQRAENRCCSDQPSVLHHTSFLKGLKCHLYCNAAG